MKQLRDQPVAVVLFLGGAVLTLIAVLILLGRWSVPKLLAAAFVLAAILLCTPYIAMLLTTDRGGDRETGSELR